LDAGVGHARLRLPAMGADQRRAQVEEIARHQMTSSAESLTETFGPMSLMVPPAPLLISIEVALMVIFLPSEVSMVMPPTPGRSFSVTVALSVLKTFICGRAREAGGSPTPPQQPLPQTASRVTPP